jgi:hypothetical protein
MNGALKAIPSIASIQGQLWSAGVADRSMLREPLHGPLWHARLESAEVKRGARLLPIGEFRVGGPEDTNNNLATGCGRAAARNSFDGRFL